MLLRTLFLLALLVTIAGTILHACGALAHAALHRRAVAAARAGLTGATQLAQSAIAASMQNGSPVALPSPSSTCVQMSGTTCELMATSTVQIATPAPNASQGCPSTQCVVYMQNNDSVAESRVAVRIAATVGAPGGAVLAERDATVIFRTMLVPPYAMLAGSNDATMDEFAVGGTGDDGGSNANGANTLITSVYKNGATTMPADVWGLRIQHPQPASPSWSQ
jgi:hypothetical protein